MPDRLIEIGWTLTLFVTVPVVILGMVYCVVTMVRERQREKKGEKNGNNEL